ncbi:uncharacterized protein JCM15063_000516 [Sporobolomyces koalae]|uniref:uncharacterized protein n=1 Tax=Sporobolomyces koalae TaxID=500713 RepID=UPI003181A013
MEPASRSFPLAELPYEIVIRIVHAVDERDSSPTFPAGPSDDLLALSATNKWFSRICRPLLWRSIKYVPLAPGPHPLEFRKARSLQALSSMVRDTAREPIRVQQLSVELAAGFFLLREQEEETDQTRDFLDLVTLLVERGLQVLFLKELTFSREEAIELLDTIRNAPRLSALRFNQVELQSISRSYLDDLPPFEHIRTLQVMHGSSQLLDLLSKCPNLDSLLLWPSSRRLAPFLPSILNLLPRLRLLSMDSVRDPSTFLKLAHHITELASRRFADPLQLEELFLEGPMAPTDRSTLIESLQHLPRLRRLALYQARNPTPALFNEIHAVRPDLDSLTVVAGDCDGSVLWPCHVEDYMPSLSLFKNLSFFACDRRTPPSPSQLQDASMLLSNPSGGVTQAALEFGTFSKLAKACPGLQEAVAIDQDVSEGTSGYFALFDRKEKGKIRISQKIRTANDFLVSYERWVRVEED